MGLVLDLMENPILEQCCTNVEFEEYVYIYGILDSELTLDEKRNS